MQITATKYKKKNHEVNDINLHTCSFNMKYPLFIWNLWRNAEQLKRNVILMAKTYKPGFVFFLEVNVFASDPVCILLILALFGGGGVGFRITLTWT